ncbi:hypothetical protein [Ferrovibrio terrae]|uniref:hypothetical protein n=1 Tax=Ferrovibrio terrae TaxID=2594003 RepID=UPI0031383928
MAAPGNPAHFHKQGYTGWLTRDDALGWRLVVHRDMGGETVTHHLDTQHTLFDVGLLFERSADFLIAKRRQRGDHD